MLNDIPIKEGLSSGSTRFLVEKESQNEKTDNGIAKPHQKGKEDIQSLKTVL